MCGRFRLKRTWREIHDLYALTGEAAPNLAPRWNIAPSQDVLAVRIDAAGTRAAVNLRWGFVPAWANDTKRPMINARSETVAEKPAFRAAFRLRRCVVVADGWYEWQAVGKMKLPWLFEVGDGEPIAFAAIWEARNRGPEPPAETVALMTTEPNALCARVHDRMPVVLEAAEIAEWLSPATPAERLQAMLDGYPDARMTSRRVGVAINSARVEGPELEAPV